MNRQYLLAVNAATFPTSRTDNGVSIHKTAGRGPPYRIRGHAEVALSGCWLRLRLGVRPRAF